MTGNKVSFGEAYEGGGMPGDAPPVAVIEAPEHIMPEGVRPICVGDEQSGVVEHRFRTPDGEALVIPVASKKQAPEAVSGEGLIPQTDKKRFLSTRGGRIAAALTGALALSAAGGSAAMARYNSMGPALNNGSVQKNLDFQLDKNDCSAFKHRLAKVMGLRTKEGVDKYLTGANVDAGKRFTAKNRGKNAWKGNSASAGCDKSVSIRNTHKSSVAYKIQLKEIPPSLAYKFKQMPNGKFELRNAAIRGLCTNVLDRKLPKNFKRGTPTRNYDMDFSKAISKDLAIAAAIAESDATQVVTVKCPNATVRSKNSATAQAAALAAASTSTSKRGTIVYQGTRGTSYATAMAHYTKKYNEAFAAAAASARTSITQELDVDCGQNPPPPECPPGSIKPECNPPLNNPPTGEMAPPDHLYPKGIGKICVKNIVDLDGDPVKAFGFRVYKANDPQKLGVGTFKSEVYEQAGGAQCRDYEAPPNSTNTQQSLTAEAQVTDGKNPTPVAPKNFILLANDFGPAN